MKRTDIERLNTAIAEREPMALVTWLASGEQKLFHHPNTRDMSDDLELSLTLSDAFNKDRSTIAMVDGEELFNLRGSSALPAAERVEIVQDRIIEAAEESDSQVIVVTVEPLNVPLLRLKIPPTETAFAVPKKSSVPAVRFASPRALSTALSSRKRAPPFNVRSVVTLASTIVVVPALILLYRLADSSQLGSSH